MVKFGSVSIIEDAPAVTLADNDNDFGGKSEKKTTYSVFDQMKCDIFNLI